uniref:Uncharacterized protein n=1 Tax=Anguilla anguilla TaxID=7936 RepID=A0A0E9WQM2_ANGAN
MKTTKNAYFVLFYFLLLEGNDLFAGWNSKYVFLSSVHIYLVLAFNVIKSCSCWKEGLQPCTCHSVCIVRIAHGSMKILLLKCMQLY